MTPSRITLTRPPRNDDELHSLVKALWGMDISRAKVCHDHDAPFSWFSDSFFGRQPITLAKGSRGLSGKSYAMSALGLTLATVLGTDVNILGGSLAQSQNLHSHMKAAWEYGGSPSYMIRQDSNTLTELTNEAKIRPLTASQRTVRGPHPARLLLDEVDEIKQDIFDAAKGQPMPQKNWLGLKIPAQTAMTSTLQYADGVMIGEIKRMAEQGLKTHAWCYRESLTTHGGWLTPEFVEQKRLEMPAEMWRVEYELGEPSIGNRAFDHEAIEVTFAGDEPEYLSNSNSHQEVAFAGYDQTRDYVISADWAKTKDYTVIIVWDTTDLPMQCVYYVRINRRQYPVMINIFNTLQKHYRAQGIHDATGLGGVVTDYIEGDAWNFQMTGRQRDDMLSDYVAAVENNKVRAPKIHTMYSEHKFASWEDLFSRSKEYHLPDTVCAAALAWKVVSGRHVAASPAPLPRSEANWMAAAVAQNVIPQDHMQEKEPYNDPTISGVVRDRTEEEQSLFI